MSRFLMADWIRRIVPVAAFHGGNQGSLDVVADHPVALAAHFGPDQR
jgi:hypothetical protein